MRMLTATALAVVLFALSPAFAQDAPGQDPERLAAAREMMEVTGVTQQLDGMIAAMTQGFTKAANAEGNPQGKQVSAEFDTMMQKFLGYKADMLKDFEVLYAETFTAAEMKEVSAFYRSGTGAKFIASSPALMQKGSEIGMKYSQKMIQDMGAEKK